MFKLIHTFIKFGKLHANITGKLNITENILI